MVEYAILFLQFVEAFVVGFIFVHFDFDNDAAFGAGQGQSVTGVGVLFMGVEFESGGAFWTVHVLPP